MRFILAPQVGRKTKMEILKKKGDIEKKLSQNKDTLKEKFFKENPEFEIKKKYEIVINCLENEKKVHRYIKKLKSKNYKPTFLFEDKSNCFIIKLCLFLIRSEAEIYLEKIKSEITKEAWIYIWIR